MLLVGGNELSFLSISSAICFYLVINKSSSVWWQQAEGCALAVAISRRAACQGSLSLHRTRMQMQQPVQVPHAHNHTSV